MDIAAFLNSSSNSRSGLMFGESSVGLGDDWDLLPFFAAANLTNPIISIGGSRVGLPFHSHTSAWEVNVVGKKLWFIAPPVPSVSSLKSLSLAELFLPSTLEFALERAAHWKQKLGMEHCILEPNEVRLGVDGLRRGKGMW